VCKGECACVCLSMKVRVCVSVCACEIVCVCSIYMCLCTTERVFKSKRQKVFEWVRDGGCQRVCL